MGADGFTEKIPGHAVGWLLDGRRTVLARCRALPAHRVGLAGAFLAGWRLVLGQSPGANATFSENPSFPVISPLNFMVLIFMDITPLWIPFSIRIH